MSYPYSPELHPSDDYYWVLNAKLRDVLIWARAISLTIAHLHISIVQYYYHARQQAGNLMSTRSIAALLSRIVVACAANVIVTVLVISLVTPDESETALFGLMKSWNATFNDGSELTDCVLQATFLTPASFFHLFCTYPLFCDDAGKPQRKLYPSES